MTQSADNNMGTEGARFLSEALKTNTTLKTLIFSCEEEDVMKESGLSLFKNQHNTTQHNKQRT